MFIVRRHHENPLLTPRREHPWEALATYNPSVVRCGEGLRMYYRALSNPAAIISPYAPQSTIGAADSADGVHFHSERQVIAPTEPWEAFGCEDPRATVFDGITYLTYTALGGFPFSADNIKVGIAISKDGEHFTERHLVTPFNAKALTFFPEKIDGEYVAILTAHTDWTEAHQRPTIAIARSKSIEDFWNPEFWNTWHASLPDHALANLRRTDEDHIEVGAAPLKTDRGWLLIYSYIQHYYDESRRSFGVEAALLDLKDPRKVISRTYPFMVPEEIYERYGVVKNIVFPTSALENPDGTLDLYYGGADTVCAKATIRRLDLLEALDAGTPPAFVRAKENPVISPVKENPFESRATFNPAAFELDGSIHILYRAMGEDATSTIGYARSSDGIHIDERLSTPIYTPRADFEMKKQAGNSGTEDPRVSVIGNYLYMVYTAYDGVSPPKGAITSLSLDDFRARRFENWSKPLLLTPDNIDDKDLAVLPAMIEGRFLLYHRIAGRICADILPDLASGTRVSKCVEIMGPREGLWDAVKVGIAGPPIATPEGWLMLYHGVSNRSRYRVGAALLDPSGTTVLSRSADPIFEPIEQYEKEGEVANVVFPCGTVVRGDTIFMYYGGADKVIGVATGSLSRILKSLT